MSDSNWIYPGEILRLDHDTVEDESDLPYPLPLSAGKDVFGGLGTFSSLPSVGGTRPIPRDSFKYLPSDSASTKITNDLKSAQLFACPFTKFNPVRYSALNVHELNYRGCGQCYLTDISRLKQHLYRVHERPHYYCAVCYTVYKDQISRDRHTASHSCTQKPCPFDDRMTTEQIDGIKKKTRGKDATASWYHIYGVLFPGAKAPSSPFVTHGHETEAVKARSDHFLRTFTALFNLRMTEELAGDSTIDSEILDHLRSSVNSVCAGMVRNLSPGQSDLLLEGLSKASPIVSHNAFGNKNIDDIANRNVQRKLEGPLITESRRAHTNLSSSAVDSSKNNATNRFMGITPTQEPLVTTDIQQLTGDSGHGKILPSNVSDRIRKFYDICKNGIKFARVVHNHDSDDGDDNETRTTRLNQQTNLSCSRNPAGLNEKRKIGADGAWLESDDDGNTEIATAKRQKQKGILPCEFPCWWYMRNPVRYSDCATNCSRNRDLHSYRRHHFDEHWRWADIESEGITFENWNAAKHATCSGIRASPHEKDKLKWSRTYRILFGLSEADAVPDNVCPSPNHVHIKPKRRIVQPLPVMAHKTDTKKSSTEDIAGSVPSLQQNENKNDAQLPFLGETLADLDTRFFPTPDMENLCQSEMYSVEANLESRADIATGLLDLVDPTNELNALVTDHVTRISNLLCSMVNAPDQVSCSTIRQISNYAIDFESSYNHAIITSMTSARPAPLTTAVSDLSFPPAITATPFPQASWNVPEVLSGQTVSYQEPNSFPDGFQNLSESHISGSEEGEEQLPVTPEQVVQAKRPVDQRASKIARADPLPDGDSFDLTNFNLDPDSDLADMAMVN